MIEASHITRLVDHLEDEQFDEVLFGVLQEKGPAAEVNGFLYARGHRDPRPVAWCGRPAGTAQRVDCYSRIYHRLDPSLCSLPISVHGGETLVDVLTPNRIGNTSYRRTCFETPAFRQKISIAHADSRGEWTILNIYLGDQGVGEDAAQQLAAFGALLGPFLRRRGRGDHTGGAHDCEHADDRVSRRLNRRFPALTPRETRVCALTMIGKTSGEIATTLGIRPGTVITYRRRAYERLGISSAASLLAEIL